jgi:hypothetical protein
VRYVIEVEHDTKASRRKTNEVQRTTVEPMNGAGDLFGTLEFEKIINRLGLGSAQNLARKLLDSLSSYLYVSSLAEGTAVKWPGQARLKRQ